MFPASTKILVVDDMMTMRKLVKKSLTELGFNNITEAKDGMDAWSKIELALKEGKPYELVLCDWNMPNMRGIELLKKVRHDSQFTEKLPFVMITAESEKGQVMSAIQEKVTGYIVKPFTTDTMKQRLEAAYQASLKAA